MNIINDLQKENTWTDYVWEEMLASIVYAMNHYDHMVCCTFGRVPSILCISSLIREVLTSHIATCYRRAPCATA